MRMGSMNLIIRISDLYHAVLRITWAHFGTSLFPVTVLLSLFCPFLLPLLQCHIFVSFSAPPFSISISVSHLQHPMFSIRFTVTHLGRPIFTTSIFQSLGNVQL